MARTFKQNVIVVGAGASREFGLPTGLELTDAIAGICDISYEGRGSDLTRGDQDFLDTLQNLAVRNGLKAITPYLAAARKIHDNMPLAPSIDNFLDSHREDKDLVLVGKLSIAHAIQKAERSSYLYIGDSESARDAVKRAKESWLVQLFKILVAQRSFVDFLDALAKITFVSFNYDRCIHQFFYFAVESYFGLNSDKITNLEAALNVIYPYGSVGNYVYGSDQSSNFGEIKVRDSLIESAENLRTFTEGAGSKEVMDISSAFEQAEMVMFLGFGFLPLNMALLFRNPPFFVQKVIGTAKGLSNTSMSEIVSELQDIFPPDELGAISLINDDRIELLQCTCGQLFEEYHRYLTK